MNIVTQKHAQEALTLKSFVDPYIQELIAKHKGFIAGGAITSIFTRKRINDVDIYFHSVDDMNAFYLELNPGFKYKNNTDFSKTTQMKADAQKKAQVVFETENAVSFWLRDKKYQIIKAFYGQPGEIFDKFDFTINMGAWIGDYTFELHEKFFQHLGQRRLVINLGTEYPISTVVRMFKYQKKGFIISGGEVIKIILGCHHLKMINLKQLKRQLQGIDNLFQKPLTDYIDKPENEDKEYDYDQIIKLLEDLFEKYQDLDIDQLFDQHGTLQKNENITTMDEDLPF